ncbi:MAG TPA: medium chain dehydrogenase/reductase family protein [Myxococcota bacterium]|jgi:NADPH:quinone reductase-like Zn-dependent oxidoreductase|nr:medium chain dehydrogenase/reductase family protein [Myxococcota bacterium]
MRQIWIPKPGPPEVLELREARDPLPAPGELRVRVEASGVNFADVMGRMGMYPDLPKMPCVPGYEVAGRVDAVGDRVGSDWVGRDVLALTRFGGYSDVVCVPEARAFARPPGMSAQDGAALPVNYLTAWQLLHVMGSLHEGETVLVHSAGGGVGIAAIQLAKRAGARVFGTASAGKHERLKALGCDACIDYTRDDFERSVRELTHGRGVELVLDAVGGRSFAKSYRSLAPTGRLGMFGLSAAATGKRRNLLRALGPALRTLRMRFSPGALIDQNKGVFGVNVGHLWEEGDRVARWMERLLELYVEGALRPVVDTTVPFERAADAHHRLQDRQNFGKVLLVPA